MWEPVGPLPASVYWRRRVTAAVLALAVVSLLGWGVVSVVVRPDPDPDTTSLASRGVALSAPDQAVPGQPAVPEQAAPEQAAPEQAGQHPAPDTHRAAPAEAPRKPAPVNERLRPDDTPRGPVPVASPVPVPPTGPVPCTNAMLAVTAEVEQPAYRVGEHPVLRLTITNTSGQPCVRDLDPIRQEIVVWSGDGAARLWSSNDCNPAIAPDLRTLLPGRVLVFAVTWGGRTSVPGCKARRTPVPAGAYRVMTRLDNDISAPVPFLLTP